MKPTALLDFWQKPVNSGDPIAMIATTFALDPDFFEQSCLARFLEVSSVNEDTGSVEDIVASVELHELLQNTQVTVLADRSAPVQRTSLLWDLLGCRVEGGLLHAKVAVLIWGNATRVILGSANLTAAGYRRQIELGLAADLGQGCLFPPEVLTGVADEMEAYLRLVPGYSPGAAVFTRAANTLALFRRRIAQQPAHRSSVSVVFAPTNATTRPLDRLGDLWSGPQPLRAAHLSPFWDSGDATVLKAVRKLLTGRPAEKRQHNVAVVRSPRGTVSFSKALANEVDRVLELAPLDKETRTLHAKCLLIESNQWVAALVGSSNHTRAGLGLQSQRHREMNVWLAAAPTSKEGKALLNLVRVSGAVEPDADGLTPLDDEDEARLPSLPACFGLCWVARESDLGPWHVCLGIAKAGMPAAWSVYLADGKVALTRREWEASGAPAVAKFPLDQQTLPMYLLVQWDSFEVPWAVVADDRHALPPSPALSSLRAKHLLAALATGRSLGDIIREQLERESLPHGNSAHDTLDPLKRFENEGALLRRGRALAASLGAMQRRLERQVVTLDTLRGRLSSPLGPKFVATKIAEAYEGREQSRAEAIFSIAELALAVGRVNWAHVLEHVDAKAGQAIVDETLTHLGALRRRVGADPADLASYAERAIEEARRCLAF